MIGEISSTGEDEKVFVSGESKEFGFQCLRTTKSHNDVRTKVNYNYARLLWYGYVMVLMNESIRTLPWYWILRIVLLLGENMISFVSGKWNGILKVLVWFDFLFLIPFLFFYLCSYIDFNIASFLHWLFA